MPQWKILWLYRLHVLRSKHLLYRRHPCSADHSFLKHQRERGLWHCTVLHSYKKEASKVRALPDHNLSLLQRNKPCFTSWEHWAMMNNASLLITTEKAEGQQWRWSSNTRQQSMDLCLCVSLQSRATRLWSAPTYIKISYVWNFASFKELLEAVSIVLNKGLPFKSVMKGRWLSYVKVENIKSKSFRKTFISLQPAFIRVHN